MGCSRDWDDQNDPQWLPQSLAANTPNCVSPQFRWPIKQHFCCWINKFYCGPAKYFFDEAHGITALSRRAWFDNDAQNGYCETTTWKPFGHSIANIWQQMPAGVETNAEQQPAFGIYVARRTYGRPNRFRNEPWIFRFLRQMVFESNMHVWTQSDCSSQHIHSLFTIRFLLQFCIVPNDADVLFSCTRLLDDCSRFFVYYFCAAKRTKMWNSLNFSSDYFCFIWHSVHFICFVFWTNSVDRCGPMK